MLELGWAWCAYHIRYESSAKFSSAKTRVQVQSSCKVGMAWHHIRNKYGMSEAQWHEMLIRQSGRCALCDEPMRDPVVDHSHSSGEVRHLLHTDCNWWAGFYEKSPDRFWRVSKKLRRLKKYNIPVEDDTTVPFAELDSAA